MQMSVSNAAHNPCCIAENATLSGTTTGANQVIYDKAACNVLVNLKPKILSAAPAAASPEDTYAESRHHMSVLIAQPRDHTGNVILNEIYVHHLNMSDILAWIPIVAGKSYSMHLLSCLLDLGCEDLLLPSPSSWVPRPAHVLVSLTPPAHSQRLPKDGISQSRICSCHYRVLC